mmetsp:Transcript_71146/g.231069  ORF Transcript_71146/g.231069 Transcript_71146/m.231069 type:complete len:241 (+) Transcript_71146:193-915(+)
MAANLHGLAKPRRNATTLSKQGCKNDTSVDRTRCTWLWDVTGESAERSVLGTLRGCSYAPCFDQSSARSLTGPCQIFLESGLCALMQRPLRPKDFLVSQQGGIVDAMLRGTRLARQTGRLFQLHGGGQAFPDCVLQSIHHELFRFPQLLRRGDARRLDAGVLASSIQSVRAGIREGLLVLLPVPQRQPLAFQALVSSLGQPVPHGLFRVCGSRRRALSGRGDGTARQGWDIAFPPNFCLR